MDKSSGHVSQCQANLVIDEQLPIWDKNNLCKYRKIYLKSKTLIFLKSEFNFLISQQFTPSIKTKINLINNYR